MACIEYDGTRNDNGYGVLPVAVHGSRLAHRAALAEALGRPVEGNALHSCDNPPCVNPEHLREGTQRDNVNDMLSRGRARGNYSAATECVHGHPFSPENTILKPNAKVQSGYERVCITCRRIRNQQQTSRRKAARHQRKERA